MKLSTLARRISKLVYLIKRTSFRGLTDKETGTVVWIKECSPRFFSSDVAVWSMGIIDALSRQGVTFNLRFGHSIGKLQGKNVFFAYSRHTDPFGFVNYTQSLHYICSQLEQQGCSVFPKSREVLFLENKGFMTQRFFDLNISTPRTYLITNDKDLSRIDLPFPFLVKEEHSFSSYGLHKIHSKSELVDFVQKSKYFENSTYLLAQELLNMRRDLRVIFVGDKVVHHYWRINTSSEWKPTATSYGNRVDFLNFPEQWREFIIDQFMRLGLTTGAFDIAWRNDDLATEPLILEVSPSFQPNPAVDVERLKMSYGEYKKTFMLRGSYDVKFVDLVFDIVAKQISLELSRPPVTCETGSTLNTRAEAVSDLARAVTRL